VLGQTSTESWAEYFVASERSLYGQAKLELF